MPVEIVRQMGADIVIGVNLDKLYINENTTSGLLDMANDSMNIMRHYLASYQVEKADVSVHLDLGSNTWYDFVNGSSKIQAGEDEMRKELPKLFSIISSKSDNAFLSWLKKNIAFLSPT